MVISKSLNPLITLQRREITHLACWLLLIGSLTRLIREHYVRLGGNAYLGLDPETAEPVLSLEIVPPKSLIHIGQQFVQLTTGSIELGILNRSSMVVTGFETLGAVVGSISLLNMARQSFERLENDYKDYKNFGQKVAKNHRSCKRMNLRIEEFINYWGLDVQRNDEYYEAFWGEEGWPLVHEHLAALLSQCENLAAIIHKILPETIDDQIPQADRERIEARLHGCGRRAESREAPHSHTLGRVAEKLKNKVKVDVWKHKIEELRVREDHIEIGTTRRRKAWYILRSCDQLETHLETLEHDYKALEEVVETAWRDRHGTDSGMSSKTDKQIIALTETHKYVLREANTQREETKALHHCCISTLDSLKLEISLLDGSPAENKSKVFHIFVPQPGRNVHLEVITRILGKDAPTNQVKFRPDFSSACKEAHKGGKCLLWTLPGVKPGTVTSRQKTWFIVSEVAGPSYQNEISMLSLSVRLQDITIAEKLELAYSVVESSLTLLGTPWLSALSSQTLKQYRMNNRQPPRYVLSIKEIDQNLIRNQFYLEKGALEQCIFRVGILLAEIALGTVIQKFRKMKSGLQLVITEHETTAQRQCSVHLIVNKVEKEMGKSYSEAVGFCLQDPWEPGTSYDPSFNQEEQAMELLEVCFNNILVKSDPRNPA